MPVVKAGLDKIAHPVKFAVIDDEADRVALTGDVYADTVGMAVEPFREPRYLQDQLLQNLVRRKTLPVPLGG